MEEEDKLQKKEFYRDTFLLLLIINGVIGWIYAGFVKTAVDWGGSMEGFSKKMEIFSSVFWCSSIPIVLLATFKIGPKISFKNKSGIIYASILAGAIIIHYAFCELPYILSRK